MLGESKLPSMFAAEVPTESDTFSSFISTKVQLWKGWQ